MRRFILLSTLALALLSGAHGQSIEAGSDNDELIVKKNSLLADLQALEAESFKLEKPLALAVAKAEVAAAAWTLDETWAKKLLTEAYELTFPQEEEERAKLRNRPAGAAPIPPTGNDRARSETRNRVLQIAGRDRAFADSLVRLSAKQLGAYEAHFRYASLADRALKDGNKEAAGQYLLQSIEADPTQITAAFVILDVAAHDRPAADKLLLQYIERLRDFPLSAANHSALRVYYSLGSLVFPTPNGDRLRRQIPMAGAAAIRAYVAFIVESIGRMEQIEPGSAQRLRGFLLGVWPPLKQYAPELTGKFFELEKLSRRPGDDGSLPQPSTARETDYSNYEERVKKALNKEQPDELIIHSAISRGDFERARKLIAKLPDSTHKTQLTEMCNTKEATTLAARGDILGAERLAEQLTRASSLLEAYPAIIKHCLADKKQTCAANLLVSKAVRQLKRADLTPNMPPAGIPLSVVPSNREFDPVLSGLSKLATLIAPLDEQLALEVLDEVIVTANASALDTTQGRTGLEVEPFRQLAPRNEVRVRQAAEAFKDRLRRIVVLSAIYQAQAAALTQAAKK
ncbi:MAG TPA: hypothetical protein VF527_14160 [Pyrinomonadaceae bacterium]|jgi:hypothetical protein